MKKQGAMAALALVAATMTFADEPEPNVGGLKAYELPGYTIVTHDEGKVRQVPRLVGQIDGVLAKLLNRSKPVPSTPTFICFLRDSDWLRYIAPGTGISGEFLPGRFANYLVLSNAGDVSNVGPAVFHQYTHWFLQTQFEGTHPLWFDEGLATFVESAEFRGTAVVLGEPLYKGIEPGATALGRFDYRFVKQNAQSGWIPLQRLLSMDKKAPEYRVGASSSAIHWQSWTFVHRGLAGDPGFGKQMFAFLAAQNAGEPIDAAVEASFGMSVDKLDADLYAYQSSAGLYLTSSNFKVLKLPIGPAPNVQLPPGRAMTRLESLELLAEMMLASGFHDDRLLEVANAINRANPDSGKAVALRLRAAARLRDDEGFERIFRASESHTLGNYWLTRGAGMAAFDRWHLAGTADSLTPAQRERLAERAFDLLDRAIMSRPDDAEAAWAYALLSATLKRDVQNANRRLRAVMAIWPANGDLESAMARLQTVGDASEIKAGVQ